MAAISWRSGLAALASSRRSGIAERRVVPGEILVGLVGGAAVASPAASPLTPR